MRGRGEGGRREEEGGKIEFGSGDVAHRILRHRPQDALTPPLCHL